jgi:hypothetical protein
MSAIAYRPSRLEQLGISLATIITTVGKRIVTARLRGSGGIAGAAEPKYLAWGTGAGTAAAGDTTLFTESAESRTNGTSSLVTTTTTEDTYQVTGQIVATAPRTITNAGVFDAATSGNLFLKADFTGVVLGTGDSITFTWQWQIT